MTSLILKTAMRLILPLTLIFGLYLAFKGHNEPGGGFIGGLCLSVALVLYRMSFGSEEFDHILPFHPRWMVAAGLVMALATALAPLVTQGMPLLTSTEYSFFINEAHFHFTTAMFFDIGVMLVVVGVSVGMIGRLSEELGQ